MDSIKDGKKYIVWGLLPSLLFYIPFVIFPIFRSFVFSFYQWNGLSAPVFLGFDNFKKLFSDLIFWKSLGNNMLVLLFSLLGQIPLGILAAVVLDGKIRGAGFYRTSFFIPMILSTVVVGLLWSTILNSQVGIIRTVYTMLGIADMPDWLGDTRIAIYTLCVVILWQCVGLYMIIFLAALQNISKELIEAADIDGASEFVKLVKIRLPLLRSSIAASAILCISGSMRTFDLIYTMTQGGPAHATEVMATYMYNKTFTVYQYGYGSAVSLAICVISLILILTSRVFLLRKKEA
ncbi:carbohydrate ABC transporter permease [Treponema sp. Marseille-Q4132]|uniref:carbohydrate ABC transporter permease n=1 Tax=Treponema sp. Marseille-Q4132 TaxID=2766701 RepID=UPI0016531E59|nr:sugar ABC transporter permease [Treponema sp. Marseille-Q4132]QNL96407.1 sugar ABC transporter permease [Treponema sp. Marseille-Q4132]